MLQSCNTHHGGRWCRRFAWQEGTWRLCIRSPVHLCSMDQQQAVSRVQRCVLLRLPRSSAESGVNEESSDEVSVNEQNSTRSTAMNSKVSGRDAVSAPRSSSSARPRCCSTDICLEEDSSELEPGLPAQGDDATKPALPTAAAPAQARKHRVSRLAQQCTPQGVQKHLSKLIGAAS